MNVIDTIKHAQRMAVRTGRPWIVIQMPGHQVKAMADGPKYGAKLLERCWP